jgi:hypothetical protein
MAMAPAEAGLERSSSPDIRSRARSAGNADLFDRHDEPPDQPRDFVQTVAVVIPHGLRQAKEALIVAHYRYFGRYLVRNDRRSRPKNIGLGVWHRITSDNTPARSSIGRECVFLGLGCRHRGRTEPPDRTPARKLRFVKKARKA